MNTIKVTLSQGTDDLHIRAIQYIENEIDLTMFELGYCREFSSKYPDTIEFTYVKKPTN